MGPAVNELDGIYSTAHREHETAWERYLDSCTDYIKRQVLVYQNWPQRRYDALGYREEKVFEDQNA